MAKVYTVVYLFQLEGLLPIFMLTLFDQRSLVAFQYMPLQMLGMYHYHVYCVANPRKQARTHTHVHNMYTNQHICAHRDTHIYTTHIHNYS